MQPTGTSHTRESRPQVSPGAQAPEGAQAQPSAPSAHAASHPPGPQAAASGAASATTAAPKASATAARLKFSGTNRIGDRERVEIEHALQTAVRHRERATANLPV